MYQHYQSNLDYVGVTTECVSFEIIIMLGDLTFSNHASLKKVVHVTWWETWHNTQETSLQPWKEIHTIHTPQLSPKKKWALLILLFIASFNIQHSLRKNKGKKMAQDGFIKIRYRRVLNSTLLCCYNGKNYTHFHTEENSYPSSFCLYLQQWLLKRLKAISKLNYLI